MPEQFENIENFRTYQKEIYDYIVSLDSTDNAIISISHCPMNGERVMTMVVSGS